LTHFAVDARDQMQVRRIKFRLDHGSNRRERVVAFADEEAAELALTALQYPVAYVVPARVAEYIIERIAFGNIACFLADDHREFPFEMNVLSVGRIHDAFFVADHRGAGFHEQHGERWR